MASSKYMPPEQALGHCDEAGRSVAPSQDCAGVLSRRISPERLDELRWLVRQWKGTAAGEALKDALVEMHRLTLHRDALLEAATRHADTCIAPAGLRFSLKRIADTRST
jgi:hypothetical protein